MARRPESRFRESGRRVLSRGLAWSLRRRSRPYPFQAAARTLVIAPHPDDETLGCAGLLILKHLAARPVTIAYLTDGSASHPGHPRVRPAELAELRAGEARAAAALCGVAASALHFLGARDGTLDRLAPAAAEVLTEALATVIAAARPEEIFLPCRHDGSSEHEAAFPIVLAALRRAQCRPRVFEYPIWSWWSPRLRVRLLFSPGKIWRADFRGHEHLKQRALAQYASQFEPLPPWPRPAMSPAFAACFAWAEEFYFEAD